MMKIIDFYADWCGPCKMMSKELEKVYDIDIEIEKIDIDADPESAEDYNVRSIPTLVFINDDAIVHRHTGYLTSKKIQEILDKYK